MDEAQVNLNDPYHRITAHMESGNNLQSRPLISVLVLAFNHENFAEAAINSIFEQFGDFDLEIIYCDDASTDNTKEIVTKIAAGDSRHKLTLRTRNVGMVQNFIDGLNNCTGDYIAYCDGDDMWTAKRKIAVQLEALCHHKQCSFSFHDVLIVDETGRPYRPWSRGRKSENWAEGVKEFSDYLGAPIIVFHASSILFRRQAVDKEFLSKIDKSATGLDYALALMLSNSGSGYYFPDTMAAYRRHSRSVSSSQRSPFGYLNILKQVRSLEQLANRHFAGRFSDFCRQNRKGHVVQALHALAEMSSRDRSLQALVVFLIVSLRSWWVGLISTRDILYVVRLRLLQRPG